MSRRWLVGYPMGFHRAVREQMHGACQTARSANPRGFAAKENGLCGYVPRGVQRGAQSGVGLSVQHEREVPACRPGAAGRPVGGWPVRGTLLVFRPERPLNTAQPARAGYRAIKRPRSEGPIMGGRSRQGRRWADDIARETRTVLQTENPLWNLFPALAGWAVFIGPSGRKTGCPPVLPARTAPIGLTASSASPCASRRPRPSRRLP